MEILIVLAILLALISFWMHKSADKSEEKFAIRPFVITNPAQDLFVNQKYAIVKLLAFIQGSSLQSIYDEESCRIIEFTIDSLGLSHKEVELLLRSSMQHDPEDEMERIFSSLKEIHDRNYLSRLYENCMLIVKRSESEETMMLVRSLFKELGIS